MSDGPPFFSQLPQDARMLPSRRREEADAVVKRPKGWAIYADWLDATRRSYERGNILALYDGLVLCRSGDLPMPDWLADGLQEMMVAALSGGVKGKEGAWNSVMGRIQKDIARKIRAHTVYQIREFQKDHSPLAYALLGPHTEFLISGALDGFRYTLPDAGNMAHIVLRGTPAAASAETILSDYKKHRDDSPNVGIWETMLAFGADWPNWTGSPPRSAPNSQITMEEALKRWRRIADAATSEAKSRSGRKKKGG